MTNVIKVNFQKPTKYSSMSRLQLLEEMVTFQEDRKAKGELTLDLIHRGIEIFSRLEQLADSQELRILSGSYCRHLRYELAKSHQT